MSKTKYLKVGEDTISNLQMDTDIVKGCGSFKYLDVTLSSNDRSMDDINNKMGRGKTALRQLNSILWNNNITRRTKHVIYVVFPHEAENYGNSSKDKESACWRWRWIFGVGAAAFPGPIMLETTESETEIMDTVERKCLIYGMILTKNAIHKVAKTNMAPQQRTKRIRPPRCWKEDVTKAMAARGLIRGDFGNPGIKKTYM